MSESTIATQDAFTGLHNRYSPQEFVQRSPARGEITIDGDTRAVQVAESFITGVHAGVEEEVGESAGLLMYRSGYEWGLKHMKRFNERMRKEYGGGKKDIWQMNTKFVFESWWWPLTLQGFGGWSLDLQFDNRNFAVVEIRNSAVAQTMEQSGKPVCHMYAGLFAGAFTFHDRKERASIELQCYSMGSDRCKFIVGENKEINAAEFWVNEGASAAEVIGKI